jgi:dihydroorotase-like cyclic amidohydrolase
MSCAVEHVVPLSGQSLVDTYQKWREQADGAVCCDYGLHVAVPTWNTKVAAEMEVLVKDKG